MMWGTFVSIVPSFSTQIRYCQMWTVSNTSDSLKCLAAKVQVLLFLLYKIKLSKYMAQIGNNYVEVNPMQQQQHREVDCHLFPIAFATELAHVNYPVGANYAFFTCQKDS